MQVLSIGDICMKFPNLFSGKNKKIISVCHLLKILQSMLSFIGFIWEKLVGWLLRVNTVCNFLYYITDFITKHAYSNIITKTCLYNFDPLKPHFYIVKLGFTGVCIIFLISAQNIDCGYSLEPPVNPNFTI